MALTQPEIDTLTNYLTGHNIKKKYPTSLEIQTWLDSFPDPLLIMSYVVLALQINECYNIFVEDDAAWWIANVCLNINNGTDIPVQSLGTNDQERRNAIVVSVAEYIQSLTSMNIIQATFQQVMFLFLSRDPGNAFTNLLDLMISHGDISENSKMRVLIEINIHNKRWQSLGLSVLPTLSELDSII